MKHSTQKTTKDAGPETERNTVPSTEGSIPVVNRTAKKLKATRSDCVEAEQGSGATPAASQHVVERQTSRKSTESAQPTAKASKQPQHVEQAQRASLPLVEAVQSAEVVCLHPKLQEAPRATRPQQNLHSKVAARPFVDGKEHAFYERRSRAPQPKHVEGVFVGAELYLRDPETERVFSAVRDHAGELCQVGRWLRESKTIDFNLVKGKEESNEVCPNCMSHK
jgi:hypothetical protein